ncbi:MAG: hypothetical protein ACP5RF_03535 [Candidatus Micrarchaeia archaeon]
MERAETFGYVFIAIGLILLLFSFYVAYNLYQNVLASAMSSGSSSSLGGSAAAIETIFGLLAEVGFQGFLMLIIAIIVLLVMISIGGRIIVYGMRLLHANEAAVVEAKETKESTQRREKAKQDLK